MSKAGFAFIGIDATSSVAASVTFDDVVRCHGLMNAWRVAAVLGTSAAELLTLDAERFVAGLPEGTKARITADWIEQFPQRIKAMLTDYLTNGIAKNAENVLALRMLPALCPVTFPNDIAFLMTEMLTAENHEAFDE